MSELSNLKDLPAVASALMVDANWLRYTLFRRKASNYLAASIKKRRGGERKLQIPSESLKQVQRSVVSLLKPHQSPRSSCHSFVKDRSITTNALQHVGRAYVLNIDLKDFFPSIGYSRIRGLLRSKQFSIPDEGAKVLAHICTFENTLPQGAPSSPYLSNIICRKLDRELYVFCKKNRIHFTRYCDDISFSSRYLETLSALCQIVEAPRIVTLTDELRSIVESNGFTINDQKTTLRYFRECPRVTGLRVQHTLAPAKHLEQQVKGMLYAWEKHGFELASSEFLSKFDTKHRIDEGTALRFAYSLFGKIQFIGQIRGWDSPKYLKICRQYNELADSLMDKDPSVKVPTKKSEPSQDEMRKKFDLFICHASEDKASVASPIVRLCKDEGINIWIDYEMMGWGDDLMTFINYGIANSRFGLMIVSDNFLEKNWPRNELRAFMRKQFDSGRTIILPLLVGVEREKFLDEFALLGNPICETWMGDARDIVNKVKERLERE